LTVAITRVGRGGGRPGWLVAAWVAAIGGLAAVALVAPRLEAAPSARDAPATVAIAAPSVAPAPSDWRAPPRRLLGEDGGMGALGTGDARPDGPSPPLARPAGRLSR
jgi:hypothetical protein